jgi:hypothetical protein
MLTLRYLSSEKSRFLCGRLDATVCATLTGAVKPLGLTRFPDRLARLTASGCLPSARAGQASVEHIINAHDPPTTREKPIPPHTRHFAISWILRFSSIVGHEWVVSGKSSYNSIIINNYLNKRCTCVIPERRRVMNGSSRCPDDPDTTRALPTMVCDRHCTDLSTLGQPN